MLLFLLFSGCMPFGIMSWFECRSVKKINFNNWPCGANGQKCQKLMPRKGMCIFVGGVVKTVKRLKIRGFKTWSWSCLTVIDSHQVSKPYPGKDRSFSHILPLQIAWVLCSFFFPHWWWFIFSSYANPLNACWGCPPAWVFRRMQLWTFDKHGKPLNWLDEYSDPK